VIRSHAWLGGCRGQLLALVCRSGRPWLVTTARSPVRRSLQVVHCRASAHWYRASRAAHPPCAMQLSPCAHRALCAYVLSASPSFTFVHLCSIRSRSFTFVRFRPLSFTFVPFRPPLCTFVNFCSHSFSSVHARSPPFTFVHFRSLPFTVIHFRSRSFTIVYLRSPSFILVHFRSQSFTFVHDR
jgi:hypothetical protein